MSKLRQFQLFSSHNYPVSSDSELWRYLTFEKLMWLLEKAALHHTRLDCLGDSFEGSVTKPYATKRDSGEIHGYMPTREHEATNNVRLMLSSYVTCWHNSSAESAAMWKLYAREDAGVAVVSSPARIRDAVDTTPYSGAILGPVEYLDFERDDMMLPLGTRARPGFAKRKSFEHEKEVRTMVHVDEIPKDLAQIFSPEWVKGTAERLPTGIEVKVDLKMLIQNIYMSPLAPAWLVDLVETSTGRLGLRNLVRRSKLLGEPVY